MRQGKMDCKTEISNSNLDLQEEGEEIITNEKFSMVEPLQKSIKKRRRRKKSKRKVKVNTSVEGETLVVTQIVKVKKVKKPKIQCIINLTNICEHNELKKGKGKKRSKSDKDRVVPTCRREKCCSAIYLKHKSLLKNHIKKEESSLKNSVKKGESSLKNSVKKRERPLKNNLKKRETPLKNNVKKRDSSLKKYVKKRKSLLKELKNCVNSDETKKRKMSLETISSRSFSSKNDSEKKSPHMSYEEISSDSICASDSDLDVLIKRTKDRNLCNPFDIRPPRFTSTPINISSDSECGWLTTTSFSNDNDNTVEGSEKNASFNSAKTLILKVKTEAYSPTHPTSETPEQFSPLIPKLLELMENKNDMITDLDPIVTCEEKVCSDKLKSEDFKKKSSTTGNYFRPITDSVETCIYNETTYDSEKKYCSSNIFSKKEELLLEEPLSCEEKMKMRLEKFKNYLSSTCTNNIFGEIKEEEIPKITQSYPKTCQIKIKEEYDVTDYSSNVAKANTDDLLTQDAEIDINCEKILLECVKKENLLKATNNNDDLNIAKYNNSDLSNKNLEMYANKNIKRECFEDENYLNVTNVDMSCPNVEMNVNMEVKKEFIKTENNLEINDDEAIEMDENENNLSCDVVKAEPSALIS